MEIFQNVSRLMKFFGKIDNDPELNQYLNYKLERDGNIPFKILTSVLETEKKEKMLNKLIALSDKQKCSSLLRAIAEKDVELVQNLISVGANPNCLNSKGISALRQAVKHYDLDIVKILLNAGAIVNYVSKKSESPLVTAIDMQNMEAVQLLVKHGANISEADAFGPAPFYSAIASNNEFIVSYLMSVGADVSNIDFGLLEDYNPMAIQNRRVVLLLIKQPSFSHDTRFKLFFRAQNLGFYRYAKALLEYASEIM